MGDVTLWAGIRWGSLTGVPLCEMLLCGPGSGGVA